MMAIGATAAVLSLALSSSAIVGSMQTAFYKPIAPAKPRVGIALPLGRCMNLGGELEAATWSTRPPPPQSRFDEIHAAGFRTLRLPVKWDNRNGTLAIEQIDQDWFTFVDAYVQRASAAGLNVIINMHHFRALNADPDGNADRFVALWDQIARHYADAPTTVWFELLNEPHDKLTDRFLRRLYSRALGRIRATNPTRPVIAGGAFASNPYSLTVLDLPDDPYIVADFHSYSPMSFTHQGAMWLKAPPPAGMELSPTLALQTQVKLVGLVKGYMNRTGRVPVMLEYGAIRFAPRADRLRYYRALSSAMASVGVYSCAWSDPSFTLMREGKWDQELLNSIASPKVSPAARQR